MIKDYLHVHCLSVSALMPEPTNCRGAPAVIAAVVLAAPLSQAAQTSLWECLFITANIYIGFPVG